MSAEDYGGPTNEKKELPTPGVEPGPPGWKPGILAVRPRGTPLFPPGLEPGTFRVLGGCDNHYTTETVGEQMSCTRIRLRLGFKVVDLGSWMKMIQLLSLLSPSGGSGRDRLVVRTPRCGRGNPGSNPGLGRLSFWLFSLTQTLIIDFLYRLLIVK